jgi:hypothetical protein
VIFKKVVVWVLTCNLAGLLTTCDFYSAMNLSCIVLSYSLICSLWIVYLNFKVTFFIIFMRMDFADNDGKWLRCEITI